MRSSESSAKDDCSNTEPALDCRRVPEKVDLVVGDDVNISGVAEN